MISKSEMDGEVTALGWTLSTVREVKAGRMSMLLNGKVRLVCDSLSKMHAIYPV